MEHYEVRDHFRRGVLPDLRVDFFNQQQATTFTLRYDRGERADSHRDYASGVELIKPTSTLRICLVVCRRTIENCGTRRNTKEILAE